MKILRRTANRLVTQHRQTGERIIASCCLLLALGAILLASPVPEIQCQRNGAEPQCTLIRHLFGQWQVAQPIVLQGVSSDRICGYSRAHGANCANNQFVAIVKTQIGEIYFIRYASSSKKAIADIQEFLTNSTQPSLNINSATWSLNHPISNGFLVMFAGVMIISAGSRLGSECIYHCDFDQTNDWVTITQKQMFKQKITEFPLSSIRAITLNRIGINDCIILTLQSGRWVCIAQAFWGKKQREYRPSVGFVRVNKTLKKEMRAIATFLHHFGMPQGPPTDQRQDT